MADCPVCLLPFNRAWDHRPIECPACNESVCITCVKTQLTAAHGDPRCAACNAAWTDDFIDTRLTKVWVNSTFRAHRTKHLEDRQKARFPEIIARELFWDTEAAAVTDAGTELSKVVDGAIQAYLEKMAGESHADLTLTAIATCRDAIVYSIKQKFKFEGGAVRKRLEMGGAAPLPSEVARAFVRACPTMGCHGMLSTRWHCNLCDAWVCPECHEIKPGGEHDAAHHCDPGAVETVKLIAKETKPCPKCGTRITKLGGCSQMWCTNSSCGCLFDWTTMKIDMSGRNHTPAWYDFLRRTGKGDIPRAVGDIPCGGVPDWHYLRNHIPREYSAKIAFLIHFHDHTTAALRGNHGELKAFNLDASAMENNLKLLKKEITGEEWSRKLYLDWTKSRRTAERRDNMTVLTNILAILLQNVETMADARQAGAVPRAELPAKLDAALAEFHAAVKLTNDEFRRLAGIYKVRYPFVGTMDDKGKLVPHPGDDSRWTFGLL